jgi:predicted RNA-binding protein (virulence factor B family)
MKKTITDRMAAKVKRLDRAVVDKLVIRLAMALDGIPYQELTELETRLFNQMKAAGILRLSDSSEVDEIEVEYNVGPHKSGVGRFYSEIARKR